MSISIFLFQAFIFLSILFCGYWWRHVAVAFWICWTVVAVFTSFLFLLQIATIGLAWHVAGTTRDTPLKWWWHGWPEWARDAEKLLADSKKLRSQRFGYIEFVCAHCSGGRCEGVYSRLGGYWAMEKPRDPDSADFFLHRSDFLKQLESTIASANQSDPDHHWIKKMTATVEYMKSGHDMFYASENFRRYEWASTHASEILLAKVHRFTLSDLLTVAAICFALVFAIEAILLNATGGISSQNEVILLTALLISLLSLTARILNGFRWKKKGIRLEHYFALDGGLISFVGSQFRRRFASNRKHSNN
jgi:hypothetical protein